MGYNYISLNQIPAPGTKFLIYDLTFWLCITMGSSVNIKCCFISKVISIIKIRQSCKHLTFIMEIATHGKTIFTLKWGQWSYDHNRLIDCCFLNRLSVNLTGQRGEYLSGLGIETSEINQVVLNISISGETYKTSGWKTKNFWHLPGLGSLLYSLYKIPLAQACFPLA